jgi:diacylglycerol kinase family enzyme
VLLGSHVVRSAGSSAGRDGPHCPRRFPVRNAPGYGRVRGAKRARGSSVVRRPRTRAERISGRLAPVLVITNDAAGGSDRGRPRWPCCAARRRRGGGRHLVNRPTATPAVARLGERRVVICGGDGSVHTVRRALHRAGALDRPVGADPARAPATTWLAAVGLPLDPAAAAGGARRPPQALDLLVDDTGGVVVNAVHLGVGAEAARQAASAEAALGRLAVTWSAACRPASPLPAGTLTVRVDGAPLTSGRVLQVGIGLGRSVGGGSPLTPHSVLDTSRPTSSSRRRWGFLARLGYGLRLGAGPTSTAGRAHRPRHHRRGRRRPVPLQRRRRDPRAGAAPCSGPSTLAAGPSSAHPDPPLAGQRIPTQKKRRSGRVDGLQDPLPARPVAPAGGRSPCCARGPRRSRRPARPRPPGPARPARPPRRGRASAG